MDSKENSPLSPQPEAAEEPKKEIPSADQQRRRQKSAFKYIAVLFAAAFLLMLYTYLMERRQHEILQRENQEQINTLQQSASAAQSIQQLMDDNKSLREQVKELEEQAAALSKELDNAKRDYSELSDSYEEYVGYTSVLSCLFSSEVKAAERDYAGSAEQLTDIDPEYLLSVIRDYDAELEHYNPEGMALRPRLDALVSTLVRRGALEEGWLTQENPQGSGNSPS